MPIASSLSPAEDPRKIDSTWHIPTGGKKRELGLSQLTRVMNAVWEKMGVEENGEVIVRLAFRFRYPQGLGYCRPMQSSSVHLQKCRSCKKLNVLDLFWFTGKWNLPYHRRLITQRFSQEKRAKVRAFRQRAIATKCRRPHFLAVV
jgi:hypothetical protein